MKVAQRDREMRRQNDRGREKESKEDRNRGRESRYIAVSHGREAEETSREKDRKSLQRLLK